MPKKQKWIKMWERGEYHLHKMDLVMQSFISPYAIKTIGSRLTGIISILSPQGGHTELMSEASHDKFFKFVGKIFNKSLRIFPCRAKKTRAAYMPITPSKDLKKDVFKIKKIKTAKRTIKISAVKTGPSVDMKAKTVDMLNKISLHDPCGKSKCRFFPNKSAIAGKSIIGRPASVSRAILINSVLEKR